MVQPQLSPAELEQIRLILRGGSVVDWYRLKHETLDDVRAFLRMQAADPDDAADLKRLADLRAAAADYLASEHGYKLPSELLSCDPLDLFLYASAKRGRRRDRFFACLLLKVMHIVHHIEARELLFRVPLSQSALAQLLVEKVDAFAARLRVEGFPLFKYAGGEKAMSSLITKLLVKKEHHAAAIHDRVRFRFVVERPADVITLMTRMSQSLFPCNYVVPGQTVNDLVNFTAFVESHAAYRERAAELQLGLGHEEQSIRQVNEFSGPTYRVVGFVVDVPIRVPEEVLAGMALYDALGRVIFSLAEFQLVDRESDEENERGENRHERYRARQLLKVRDRLERGMRGAREDEL